MNTPIQQQATSDSQLPTKNLSFQYMK
jgi:hypothetical protein